MTAAPEAADKPPLPKSRLTYHHLTSHGQSAGFLVPARRSLRARPVQPGAAHARLGAPGADQRAAAAAGCLAWRYRARAGGSGWQPHPLPVQRLDVALLGGLLLAFLLGLLLKRVEGDLSLETSAVYHALDWFYFDMHFGENPADDVRCTIWVPYPRSQDHEIKALRQIVDYIPRKSKTGEKSFRYNKKAGRVFRIYHVVNGRDSRRGDLRCKGILGLCAADALEKGEMKVECVPDGQPFEEYMVRNWNFSVHEARYLTADRRSYLCIPMLTSDKKQLLGIIYCDSRSPTALTQKTGDDAQKYLPMIARTFAGIGRKED